MYTQKQLEELAKSSHTVVRDKAGKIIRLRQCVDGKQREIIAHKKEGRALKEVIENADTTQKDSTSRKS